MVEMELLGVRLELPANTPIVLLQEAAGRKRLLPIFIGNQEAAAIAYALEGVQTPRPLTHDLLKDVVEGLGAEVVRVVITEMHDHIYFADLQLKLGDDICHVSSRPSDAIALAVRAGAPVFAMEALLDEVGQEPAPVEAEPVAQDEILEEFRDFIEHVSPEDFGS